MKKRKVEASMNDEFQEQEVLQEQEPILEQEQNQTQKQEVKLPLFSKLVDNRGEVLGSVKKGKVKRDKRVIGEFRYEGEELVYVEVDELGNPVSECYVDRYNNLLERNTNRYVATLRYFKKSFWLPVAASLFALTLTSVLIGAWCVAQFKESIPTFAVAEEGKEEWSKDKDLEIFKNGYYDDLKIHPGLEGDYSFRLQNKNERDLSYTLSFAEVNDYDVTLRYRLRLNNSYVAGSADEYLTAAELKQAGVILPPKSTAVYTLEWKWVDGESDTEAGMNQANYTLNIQFRAKIFTLFD